MFEYVETLINRIVNANLSLINYKILSVIDVYYLCLQFFKKMLLYILLLFLKFLIIITPFNII